MSRILSLEEALAYLQIPYPAANNHTTTNAAQLSAEATNRVSAIAITSMDGRGTIQGTSGLLGNAFDASLFNTLRTNADAVLVGAQTIRSEDYEIIQVPTDVVPLRKARGQLKNVPLVTISRSLDFSAESPFVLSARKNRKKDASVADAIIYTTTPSDNAGEGFYARWDSRRQALTDYGIEIRIRPEINIEQIVTELQRQGLAHIVCEGGPRVYQQAFASDAIDDFFLTIAPLYLGEGALTLGASTTDPTICGQTPLPFSVVNQLMCDSHIFLHYRRSKTD